MTLRQKSLTAAALCVGLLTSLAIVVAAPPAPPAPLTAPTGGNGKPAADLAANLDGVARFEVFPTTVNLETARDAQSIVALYTRADGVTADVTAQAQFAFANPALAKVDGGHTVRPLADGQTELSVSFQGKTVKLPVTVKDAKADRPISFKLDVMPIFMRAGCNTGGCHGSARGKDGFMLSLFGYDPDGDFNRITRQQPGRRVNLGFPEDSLLLTKTTGAAPHTGGARFKTDSAFYQTILRWLDAGAPHDPAEVAQPVSLELLPTTVVLEVGSKLRMTARAKYSDGTDRDVTDLVVFSSTNDGAAGVTEDGAVTAKARGEAFVMGRFHTYTVTSQVIVIPQNHQYAWPKIPENNYIDTLVNAKLKKLRILPSELCTDEEFARRVHLDVVGLLPTREELERFLANNSPDKREKLVDELLKRKEFAEMWVMKWAELLQIRSDNNAQRMSYKAVVLYYNWLQDKIANNVPMDQIVQELLSASGGTFTNPAANYYQVERDALKIAENTAQVFMGMRIQCAQCHNHPFDRWTQDDYYQFAAYFAQVGRKNAEDPREQVVFNTGGGSVTHPLKGNKITPKFLGDAAPRPIPEGKDRREVVAEWLASPENPYFATNLSNIVWAHFFGKGIIDQVDDVRASNPASNPELLAALGQKFTEYKYDFKRLVKDICTSRTYQLSTKSNPTNELDTRNFAKAQVRRVRAEVLLDVINQVTDSKEKFKGLPLGSRAVQIADGRTSSFFLTTFGRATRETACSCEVKMEPNLSQALHLINGPTTNAKVASSQVITNLLKDKRGPQEVHQELYLRTLSRRPTAKEVEEFEKVLTATPPAQHRQVLDDLFWALLNAEEFIFNH